MAVIYARQSLDRDGEALAVSRQLADCRTLAKLKELTVEREYVDNDKSATKGDRPAFLELVADVEAGKVDTIICWHTDRLYRRVTDLIRLIEKAKTSDLRIFTVKSGDLDLTTPSGRMVAGMLGQAAQYEVEHKGERQKTANLERARKGVRHFAARPYGYVRIDGKVSIVESEAAVVREAINRFIAGESWYGIAKDFGRRGIVGLNGRPFSYQNLRLRVSNPAHAGVRTYLGDVVTEQGDWPPIVDRVTWERFQTALAVRSQSQNWDKKLKYLGSGIYRCGKCGDTMKVLLDYNHGRNDHPPIYQCRNFDVRRNLARVDAIVEAAVLDRLSQPDILRLLSPSEDVSALAAESQDIRARMDGLAELYSEGTLTAAAVRTQKEKLQQRLDALQVRIASAEGGSVVNALAGAKDVAAHWGDRMSILEKRRIVDALMVVTIHPTRRGGRNAFQPEDVTIEWRS
ncbi:MAG: recombinase family protein [Microbacteriaceae bacterium]